jgi:hypothetical protein
MIRTISEANPLWVLRVEGRQSEALIQLADENQPSVRCDLIP